MADNSELERAKEKILDELFRKFRQEIAYPTAASFEIRQMREGRIKAYDALLAEGSLLHEQGRLRFSPRSYLTAEVNADERILVDKTVPVLVDLLERSEGQGAHSIPELIKSLGAAGTKISELDAQRLLHILQWLSLLGGFNETEKDGVKKFSEFQISSNAALRYESFQEHIDRFLPPRNGKWVPMGSMDSVTGAFGNPAPNNSSPDVFETPFTAYRRTRVIGEGGAGTVFEVIDEDGEKFALKLLNPRKATADKTKRFKNEINFCRQNAHPNIIRVIGDGIHFSEGKRSLFYVMPLYSGSLRAVVDSKPPIEVALRLFRQLLDGINAAHAKGVYHRDLKPENLLHDVRTGQLVVADFGIAHFEEEHLATSVETKHGQRLANFNYAAPEQRERGRSADHRSDIFSIGLILNELFTGAVPQGTAYKTIASVDPRFAHLDALVERMIRQDPSARPASVEEVQSALDGRDKPGSGSAIAPKVANRSLAVAISESIAREREKEESIAKQKIVQEKIDDLVPVLLDEWKQRLSVLIEEVNVAAKANSGASLFEFHETLPDAGGNRGAFGFTFGRWEYFIYYDVFGASNGKLRRSGFTADLSQKGGGTIGARFNLRLDLYPSLVGQKGTLVFVDKDKNLLSPKDIWEEAMYFVLNPPEKRG